MRNFSDHGRSDAEVNLSDSFHERAKATGLYRIVIAVSVVVAIVIALFAVAMTSASSTKTSNGLSRAIVIVVPGLNPLLLESAALDGRTPNIANVLVNGGTYRRAASNTTDRVSALATMLTGTSADYHNATSKVNGMLSLANIDPPTFLRSAKDSSVPPATFASSSWYSNGTLDGNLQCTNVGLLDVECFGQACASGDSCNSVRQQWICPDVTSIAVDTSITSTILSTAALDHWQLFFVALDFLNSFASLDGSAAAGTASSFLEAYSNLALLDAFVGQLTLMMSERSDVQKENWLLVLTGDGASTAQQAPLVVGAFRNGVQLAGMSQSGKAAISEPTTTSNVADVYTTVMTWFGLPIPVRNAGTAVGICGSGIQGKTC